MEHDRKITLLKRILGPIRIDKSIKDELVFTCPKCLHQKPKLSINLVTDEFNCWVCHFGGKSLKGIFALSSDKTIVSEYTSEKKKIKSNTIQEVKQKPQLPEGFKSLLSKEVSLKKKYAISFLRKRGLTTEDIALYKIGFVEDGKYRNRIIIPSFDCNGELNFFVGRTFFNDDIKYKNGKFEKDIIFNELLIDWTKPVILTEGPFDAIIAGTNAIPIQGTFFNEQSKLMKNIVKANVPVYLALDSDARKYRIRLATSLMSYGICCFDVPMNGCKDFGEMTKEQAKIAISNSVEFKSQFDLMRARVMIA